MSAPLVAGGSERSGGCGAWGELGPARGSASVEHASTETFLCNANRINLLNRSGPTAQVVTLPWRQDRFPLAASRHRRQTAPQATRRPRGYSGGILRRVMVTRR